MLIKNRFLTANKFTCLKPINNHHEDRFYLEMLVCLLHSRIYTEKERERDYIRHNRKNAQHTTPSSNRSNRENILADDRDRKENNRLRNEHVDEILLRTTDQQTHGCLFISFRLILNKWHAHSFLSPHQSIAIVS